MLVLLMSGNPATGKTVLSKNIFFWMAKDRKVKLVTTLEVREEFDLFNLHSEKERNIVYGILANRAWNIIKQETIDLLIVDGNFNKESRREIIYHVAKDCDVCVVECVVEDETLINERLKYRGEHKDILENKASTKTLHDLIKNKSDPIANDRHITSGRIGFIRFDSGKNKAQIIRALNERRQTVIFDDLLSIMKSQEIAGGSKIDK